MKGRIAQDVTPRVTKTVLPTDGVQENIMDAEEADKSAPNSNTKEREGEAQERTPRKLETQCLTART